MSPKLLPGMLHVRRVEDCSMIWEPACVFTQPAPSADLRRRVRPWPGGVGPNLSVRSLTPTGLARQTPRPECRPAHRARSGSRSRCRTGSDSARCRSPCELRDHHSAPIDSQRAVLWMNAEEFGRCPAQADRLGTEALDEVGAGLVDAGLGSRADVAARRAHGAERAEGLAPIGGLGRERIGRELGKEHHGCRLMAGPTA